MGTLVSVVIFALVLSFLVLIHELGHFLVAKFFKIKVEEFGLGYPPRAKVLFRRGGTDFTLNWIPFGGFVRMKGEVADQSDAAAAEDPDSFGQKSARARLAVILAGAAVNILFGVIAFSAVFSYTGIPNGAVIAEVQPETPAAQIGMKTGEAIIDLKTADGLVPIRSVNDVVTAIPKFGGQTITIDTIGPCTDQGECQENPHTYTASIRTPANTPAGKGALGVAFSADYLKKYPWYVQPIKGAQFGIDQALGLGLTILSSLGTMVWQLGTKGVVPQDLAGPVGIVDQASQSGIFSGGIWAILLFAGMLSINLGVMNVLPIPALDGGRAFFILLEKIIGRSRVARFEGYANNIGFSLLLILIVLISARDVFRIFHKA